MLRAIVTAFGVNGAAALLAVRFSPVINLGAVLLGLLLSTFAIVGVFYAARRRSDVEGLEKALRASEGAAEAWHEERDAAIAARERLQAALDDARAQRELERDRERETRHALKGELAAERLKTDLSGALKQMSSQHAEVMRSIAEAQTGGAGLVVEAIEHLAARQTQEHGGIVRSLDLLADRIAERAGQRAAEQVVERLEDPPNERRDPASSGR